MLVFYKTPFGFNIRTTKLVLVISYIWCNFTLNNVNMSPNTTEGNKPHIKS